MFDPSIYVCGTTLEYKKNYRVSTKFHRICVFFVQKSVFSWVAFQASCVFLWVWNCEKYVPFINLCMWYQVGMKKILTGCPKNSIEFVSFWLKITQNYVKIDIMQKRHLFQAFFGTPCKCESYSNVVPHRWTDDRNNFFPIQVA